jgi:hypothetical protein
VTGNLIMKLLTKNSISLDRCNDLRAIVKDLIC